MLEIYSRNETSMACFTVSHERAKKSYVVGIDANLNPKKKD